MIDGLKLAMTQLKAAGCRTIYINGSFVTREPNPKDFDACYSGSQINEVCRNPVLSSFPGQNSYLTFLRKAIYLSI